MYFKFFKEITKENIKKQIKCNEDLGGYSGETDDQITKKILNKGDIRIDDGNRDLFNKNNCLFLRILNY